MEQNLRARYTTFDEFPEDIRKALARADCYWRNVNDFVTCIRHIKSRNLEAPLTDDEKDRIKTFIGLSMCPIEIVFDN